MYRENKLSAEYYFEWVWTALEEKKTLSPQSDHRDLLMLYFSKRLHSFNANNMERDAWDAWILDGSSLFHLACLGESPGFLSESVVTQRCYLWKHW